jgi:hypothetical protein
MEVKQRPEAGGQRLVNNSFAFKRPSEKSPEQPFVP